MTKPIMPEFSMPIDDADDEYFHAHTPTRIATSLRELICKGNLSPGAKLSEEIIAAEFEVSRNTLREAFTVLVGEDLVHKVPNRGVFVIDPGPHEVREIYQARRFIEPSAILWGQLTPELAETFNHIADQTRRGIAQEDTDVLEDTDRQFHLATAALAGSSTLSAAMDRLLTQLRLAFTGLGISPGIHDSFAQQNLALIDRILNNQRVDASRGLHKYLSLAENMVMQYATVDGKLIVAKSEDGNKPATDGQN